MASYHQQQGGSTFMAIPTINFQEMMSGGSTSLAPSATLRWRFISFVTISRRSIALT
jgi:hypothetical protein